MIYISVFTNVNMEKQDMSTTNKRTESEFTSSFFDQLSVAVDKYQQEVRIAVAGVAVVGIVIIGQTTRIFTTFRHVKNIPSRFISRHVRLQGYVKNVDDCSTLYTQHIPIISWGKSNLKKDSSLPVTLAGIDVLGPGSTWLRKNLIGQRVWFQPLAVTDKSHLDCIVTAKLSWYRTVCVNRELVAQGLAFVRPAPENTQETDVVISQLRTSLLRAETKAESWGRGAWASPTLFSRLLRRPVSTLQRAANRNSFVMWLKRYRIL